MVWKLFSAVPVRFQELARESDSRFPLLLVIPDGESFSLSGFLAATSRPFPLVRFIFAFEKLQYLFRGDHPLLHFTTRPAPPLFLFSLPFMLASFNTTPFISSGPGYLFLMTHRRRPGSFFFCCFPKRLTSVPFSAAFLPAPTHRLP